MRQILLAIAFALTCTAASAQNAYISNFSTNDVSVIDTATNTVTTTVPVGNGPRGVSVSPDGSKVYVANFNSNTVSVINTVTNTVMGTVTVGTNPISLAVSPDGSKVYVGNLNSDTVSVINTATNTVTTTVSVGAGPYAFGNFIGPAPTAVPVPTLSQWALIALGLLLAGLALIQFRRARSIQA